MEPLWNPRGTLVEPYLRAAPDHTEPIWAETPKLSAVGGKTKPIRGVGESLILVSLSSSKISWLELAAPP